MINITKEILEITKNEILQSVFFVSPGKQGHFLIQESVMEFRCQKKEVGKPHMELQMVDEHSMHAHVMGQQGTAMASQRVGTQQKWNLCDLHRGRSIIHVACFCLSRKTACPAVTFELALVLSCRGEQGNGPVMFALLPGILPCQGLMAAMLSPTPNIQKSWIASK